MIAIELACLFEYFEYLAVFRLSAGGGGTLFAWDFHAMVTGKRLHGLGKIHLVEVHDEADGIPAGTTAEAIIELALGLYAK